MKDYTPWNQLSVLPNSVLVIVDAQIGFIGPKTKHIRSAIESLLHQKNSDFLAVFATKFRNLPKSQFRTLIGWDKVAEKPETDLLESVKLYAVETINKTTYSAVLQIDKLLRKYKAQHVYLCGIDTDVCVLQNAAGLFDLGWHTLVLVDACATNGGAVAEQSAIPLLRRTIGDAQVIEID